MSADPSASTPTTNRKFNSKDESRLEEDQKTDSRSPKVRKQVRQKCIPMERRVTKSDPYDHKERLAYTSFLAYARFLSIGACRYLDKEANSSSPCVIRF